jgi:hypothetical protein
VIHSLPQRQNGQIVVRNAVDFIELRAGLVPIPSLRELIECETDKRARMASETAMAEQASRVGDGFP